VLIGSIFNGRQTSQTNGEISHYHILLSQYPLIFNSFTPSFKKRKILKKNIDFIFDLGYNIKNSKGEYYE